MRTNLAPDFPLFHGLNSVLNVKALVASSFSILRDFEIFSYLRLKLYSAFGPRGKEGSVTFTKS